MRPKVVRTVHHSEKMAKQDATRAYFEASYHDQTSLTGYPTSSIYPTKDSQGNPYTTEFGLSHYADHQTLSIQEMPEKAPAGLLPSSIDVVLDDDLVDSCKPGDRVAIVGIYRALPSKSGAEGSGTFKSVLIANHVRQMTAGGSVGVVELTREDTANIRKVARRADCFDLLARSIAPSIYGHSLIKEALLLLLLGGVEKNLPNGTHIRGDLNLLMVGDPSTAKSQLLRFILHIAPLAINTTGRGSSGVGLTAAVTSDKETGDRRLEAGAMVLADRGVVCIDEFDKMSDADRVAIHEVMEQQTVTIAKAGIHMALNARCSVVAAANPRYSQYDKNKSPAFNVNLPDSLLSRFDLLFIVLDTPDAAMDRRVADRVLNNHRYIERKGPHVFDEDADDEDAHEQQHQSIFQRFDALLHQSVGARARRAESQVLTMAFLKKFLQFAKRMEPLLTEASAAMIGQLYAELRTDQSKKMNGYPITARCLETLIRLSTAHAKSRLSDLVEEEDVRQAMRIIKSAIDGSKDGREEEKERREAEREEKRGGGGGGGDDDDGDEKKDDDDQPPRRRRRSPAEEDEEKRKRREDDRDDATDEAGEEKTPSPATRRRRRSSAAADDESPNKRRGSGTGGEEDGPQAMETEEADVPLRSRGRSGGASQRGGVEEEVAVGSVRGQQFVRLLARQFMDEGMLGVEEALEAINEEVKDGRPFTKGEAEGLLVQLEAANKVMYREGSIYRI